MFCVSILILYPGSLCYVTRGSGILAFAVKKYAWRLSFLCRRNVYFFFLVKYFVLFSRHELGTEQKFSSRITHRKKSKVF